MSMMGSEEINRSYKFDHNFKLQMENFEDEKIVSVMKMMLYMNEGLGTMGVKLEGAGSEQLDFMVLDIKKNEMLTMMNNQGQKMGMRIEMDSSELPEEENQDIADIGFEKTGQSKVISGYNCDEYKIVGKSEEDKNKGNQYFWITDDTEADWIKSVSAFLEYASRMPTSYNLPDSYPEGSVIQMVQVSEDKKTKNVITVLEVNMNDSFSYSTSGYSFMNMPSTDGGIYPGMK